MKRSCPGSISLILNAEIFCAILREIWITTTILCTIWNRAGCFPLLPDIMGLRIIPICSLMREGNPIYQYEWEGVMMTQEEYNQAFRAVYDTSSEKPGYEWDKWYSLEEVIQAIGDIQ